MAAAAAAVQIEKKVTNEIQASAASARPWRRAWRVPASRRCALSRQEPAGPGPRLSFFSFCVDPPLGAVPVRPWRRAARANRLGGPGGAPCARLAASAGAARAIEENVNARLSPACRIRHLAACRSPSTTLAVAGGEPSLLGGPSGSNPRMGGSAFGCVREWAGVGGRLPWSASWSGRWCRRCPSSASSSPRSAAPLPPAPNPRRGAASAEEPVNTHRFESGCASEGPARVSSAPPVWWLGEGVGGSC